jgi:hypothetical protein
LGNRIIEVFISIVTAPETAIAGMLTDGIGLGVGGPNEGVGGEPLKVFTVLISVFIGNVLMP